MINRFLFIFSIFCSFGLIACKEPNPIEEKLRKESVDFFQQNKVDYQELESKFIIQPQSDGSSHFTLKYYTIIDNDSLVINFSRDEQENYWMEANRKFVQHFKK